MSDTAGSRSDGFVDQMLHEAELDDDGQLRPALLQLRALRAEAPEPSAEVAALLNRAAGAPAGVQPAPVQPAPQEPAPVDELAARRRAKRRTALTALSVAVSLGAGAGVAVAAASDQDFRNSVSQFNQAVTSFVTGTGGAPAPGHVEEPAVPVPSVPTDPAVVPAAPAPAGQPADVPASDIPATVAPGPATTEHPAAGIPVPGLPTAVPDLGNGGGQQPQVPVPGPSDLPLPETLPAVPLR